jgi:hypothetical protein
MWTLRVKVYSGRIESEWREKAMDQSACRVVEACSPAYNPQSEAKKSGPWGTGSDEKLVTIDQCLEKYEGDMMDACRQMTNMTGMTTSTRTTILRASTTLHGMTGC